MKHRPKKSLGQHFLVDQYLLQAIVDQIRPQADECLVEIGPGTGVLSKRLYTHCKTMQLIELDGTLVSALNSVFVQQQRVKIIHMNALDFDYQTLDVGNTRIVGNLPYNISSQLILRLIVYAFREMYFVIQRELAHRICAAPGTEDYGRLTLMTQLYARAEKLLDLPPEAFSPRPKVWSTLIRLQPAVMALNQQQLDSVTTIVRLAFQRRRKQLSNSLSGTISVNELEHLGIRSTARPQELSLKHFINIAHFVLRKNPICA